MKRKPSPSPLESLRTTLAHALGASSQWCQRRAPIGLLLSALLVAVPTLLVAGRNHPYFELNDIRVSGISRLTRDEILGVGEITPLASIWSIDAAGVRDRIERNAWVQRADVRRILPNRLLIRVHEYKPKAIVRLDALYYLDHKGHVLGPVGPRDEIDVPIITGLEGDSDRRRARRALPRAAQLLRWCGRHQCFSEISEIRVGSDDALTIFPTDPKVSILFGWGDWSAKLARLKRVWKQFEGREQQLASIDLAHGDFAIVAFKNEAPPPTVTTVKGKGTKI